MSDQNPWLSIWVRPRETIRAIVAQNPRQFLWILAFISGFTSLMNCLQAFPAAQIHELVWMVLISVVIAPFWGYAFFVIWSYIVVLVGRIFKGQGNFESVRAAYAWSCVPLTGNLLLWLLLLVFYADFVFYGSQDQIVIMRGAVAILFLILIGKLIFSIWSIVIYLQALAEVQQFSILCSIGNVVAASIVMGLAAAVICFSAFFIFSAFAPPATVELPQTGWFVR